MSFVVVAQSSSGASGNRRYECAVPGNTKTGYMTGVLQVAAAAQDGKNRLLRAVWSAACCVGLAWRDIRGTGPRSGGIAEVGVDRVREVVVSCGMSENKWISRSFGFRDGLGRE
jgi:hypothetical protein